MADEEGYVEEGQRNETLVAIGGFLRYRGFNQSVVTSTLAAVNAEACDPPLRREEVDKIIKSVMRYKAGK